MGFNWDSLQRFIVGYRPPIRHAHARNEISVPLPKKRVIKSSGSGKKRPPGQRMSAPKRKKVLALAQARDIDVILVTELTRWGRSMLDLFHTLQDLQAWSVSLVAQTGLQFDLRSAQGKLAKGFALDIPAGYGSQGSQEPGVRIRKPPIKAMVGFIRGGLLLLSGCRWG